MAGQQLRLVLDLACRDGQRCTADRRRAAAVGAPAHRRVLGVAVDDANVVHRDAELVADDLGERRFLSLPVRRCADEDVYLAARMETDDRGFPESALEADRAGNLRRPEAADLDVETDANTDVAS